MAAKYTFYKLHPIRSIVYYSILMIIMIIYFISLTGTDHTDNGRVNEKKLASLTGFGTIY